MAYAHALYIRHICRNRTQIRCILSLLFKTNSRYRVILISQTAVDILRGDNMENNEIINQAVDYIKSNYCSYDISVGEVAEKAGFSLDYFNRIFLSYTGFTVMGYINYQRLKTAARRLRQTDWTVLEIALNVGFSSHEGFIKAFKKRYGITPSDYRNENKSRTFNLADFSDDSVIARFLHENPDLKPLDDSVWNDLFELDFKKYIYFYMCAAAQGTKLAALDGDINKAIFGIGDFAGEPLIHIYCDDPTLSAELLKRFPNASLVTVSSSEKLKNAFEIAEIMPKKVSVISRYCKEKPVFNLPDGITVKRLCRDDIPKIEPEVKRVKDMLPIGYACHLLSPDDYSDPNVLEYVVFKDGRLIMAAGCGLSDAFGTMINDSIYFYPTAEKPDNDVYRQIFAAIVSDIIDLGAVPYDDIQCGKYAEENGGFTAVEFGFEPVCYCYFF